MDANLTLGEGNREVGKGVFTHPNESGSYRFRVTTGNVRGADWLLEPAAFA